jgi:hypothetical protein
MGVTEEAGKAVGGVVDALKSTPVVLGLILMNVLFLATALWFLHEVATNTRARNSEQTQLLAECMRRQTGETK